MKIKDLNRIIITKSSGDLVDFDEKKLRFSLQRSKADTLVIEDIISEIKNQLYPNIKTKEIYKKAFELLKKYSRPTAARYKLKKAIMELGPTGFPFEQFVGALFRKDGYIVNVGVMVQGKCVTHEVDVIAEKNEEIIMVECKFKIDQNAQNNVKVPLYIHARFNDIADHWNNQSFNKSPITKGWIVTNTRFTTDALQYGNCSGLTLIGWDYPKKGSLKDRIDKSGLHPITCLTSITIQEKKKLLDLDTVLAIDLCKNEHLLVEIGITNSSKQQLIIAEAKALCLNS
jgi:hypothetical protein